MDTNRLLLALTSTDEEIRDEAREELALRMDDAIAQAILDVASSDAGEEIRADAIVAMGPIIEECGIDYDDEDLVDLPGMSPSVSREMFESIVREIGAIYSDEAEPKLVRRRAFEVLVRDPQPWHAVEVRKHFASSDADWQRTAVFGMGMMTGFTRELGEIVSKAEGDVLYEAVRAAGRMEVTAAASRIRSIATDRNADVDLRLAAVMSLPHVDPDCLDILEELKKDRDDDLAEVAEEALEELLFAEQFGEPDDDEDEELG